MKAVCPETGKHFHLVQDVPGSERKVERGTTRQRRCANCGETETIFTPDEEKEAA